MVKTSPFTGDVALCRAQWLCRHRAGMRRHASQGAGFRNRGGDMRLGYSLVIAVVSGALAACSSGANTPVAVEQSSSAPYAVGLAKQVNAAAAVDRGQGTGSSTNVYFVEFRSRYALSYGHTFLVHGRLDAKGEIGALTAERVAGLHPAGAGPELWTAGHVVPVPSETGPSDGDLEEKYVSARFRVMLSESEYEKVRRYIIYKQAHSPLWHAVIYNCNAWVGEVAQYMGLHAPANTVQYPANYINALKALNAGQNASLR